MVICLTVSFNGMTTVFALRFQPETVHSLRTDVSDKSPSNLQTVPLRQTGVICDFGVCFLLLIFLRKSLWSSFVPEPAQPELHHEELTEGMTTESASLLFTE